MEAKTAQLKIRKRCIIAEGSGGMIFWATPTRARLLIDSGAVDLVNAPPAVGPEEQPTVGPSETKPAGPLEKKYYAAVPDGRSIDSQSSSEPGTAAQSQSSEADPASLQNSAIVSPQRGRGRPRRSG